MSLTKIKQELHYDLLPGLASALQKVQRLSDRTVQTEEQLDELVRLLKTAPSYALDTETTGLQIPTLGLVGISFAFGETMGDCWYVPVGHTALDRQLPLDMVIDRLKKPLEREEVSRDMHHCKFDLAVLLKFGIEIPMIFRPEWRSVEDSMIMSWIIDENQDKRLKVLAPKFLGMEMATFKSLFGGANKAARHDDEEDEEDDFQANVIQVIREGKDDNPNIAHLAVAVAAEYAKDDALATRRLCNYFRGRLAEIGMERQYYYEMMLTPTMVHMSFNGVMIDQGKALIKHHEAETEAAEIEGRVKERLLSLPAIREYVETYRVKKPKKVRDKLTHAELLNLGSNDQKRTIFYDILKLGDKDTIKTDTGNFSTGRWALQAIERKAKKPNAPDSVVFGGAVAEDIRKLTKQTKLIQAFYKPLATQVYNGRVYCYFNNVGTRTGRFVAQNPNLQQMPKDTKTFKFRDMFIAPPGKKWVSVDLSQIELRLTAHYSQDPTMMQVYWDAFNGADIDIHSQTAMILSGKKPSDFEEGAEDPEWKSIRSKAKCYHPDTEVLTRRGWKRMIDLDQGEEIIQAIPRHGQKVDLEWVVPTDLFRKYVTGLTHLKNWGIDLRVTHDHEMQGWGAGGAPKRALPEEINTTLRYMGNAGILSNTCEDTEEALLRLAVATQADGCLTGGAIQFGFTKQFKIDRLKILLNQAGIRFTEGETVKSGRENVTWIRIGVDDSLPITSLLTPEKEIPTDWLHLSYKDREVVLDEVRYWDSSIVKGGRSCRYFSCSKQSIDTMQAIAAITNLKSRVSVDERKENNPNHNDLYALAIKDHNYSRTGNITVTEEAYEGEVVCLTVASSYILVRDKGVTVVCTQCFNFGMVYGMSKYKAYDMLINDYDVDPDTVSHDLCQKYMDDFFTGYPGIRTWIERMHVIAINQKYVETILKRKRRLPNCTPPPQITRELRNNPLEFALWKDQNRRFSGDLRIAVNTVIQGSAADLIKLMMVRIHRSIDAGDWHVNGGRCNEDRTLLLTQVHDELNFESPESVAEPFQKFVVDTGYQVGLDLSINVPVVAEGGVGATWADAK